METALLKNADKYGFDEVPCGIVETSLTFDPKKRNFCVGDGRSVDVACRDLISVDLLEAEKKALFPFCC